MVGHDRYRLLDELRGVAAVIVLIFHIATRGGGPVLFQNGYLAVDFFFMLSGFVMAEAYERRLEQGMSFAGFATRRLVRMMPVAMLGALAGGLYLLARAYAAPERSDPLAEVFAANMLNILILPKLWYGPATAWDMFPANGPLWSLFFEIGMNLVWAAFLIGRSTRTLALLTGASAVLLVVCGLHFGSLHLGWEVSSLLGGAARVSFGFGAGLLLHRLRSYLPGLGRRGAWLAVAALVYFLALPITAIGWTLAVVLVCLPAVLIIAVAAGREVALPGGALLGRLSFPLYGVHVPLIAAIGGALKFGARASGPASEPINGPVIGAASAGASSGAPLWGMLLLAPLILGISWGVLVLFDEPLRAWLTRRFVRSVAPSTESIGRESDSGLAGAQNGPVNVQTASEVNPFQCEEAFAAG